jgi:hypothetical protein
MSFSSNQLLLDVLREARELLARPSSEFVWSSWDSRDEALRQLDNFIARIEAGDMPERMDLALLFAPSGDIQEVAESSGWSHEFLALAKRLDAAIGCD